MEMEKKTTNQEIEKELLLLKREQTRSRKEIETSKTSLIEEIISLNKETIKNTPVIEKKYTLWERIKRVLGMT